MFLMRPDALLGACHVAIAVGELDRAHALHSEADEYVTSRNMGSDFLNVKATGAALHAADGDHEAAVTLLEECEALAGPDMRRILLDILATKATSLAALGRTDDAESTRARARSIADEIATLIRDEELRAAFQEGSATLLDAVPTT